MSQEAVDTVYADDRTDDTADDPRFGVMLSDSGEIPDPAWPFERMRADSMESIRLRLLWAVAGGGDDGICASCAIAVIRFAESGGRAWHDHGLKGLHRRLCEARGLPKRRYYEAVKSLRRCLFLPV